MILVTPQEQPARFRPIGPPRPQAKGILALPGPRKGKVGTWLFPGQALRTQHRNSLVLDPFPELRVQLCALRLQPSALRIQARCASNTALPA